MPISLALGYLAHAPALWVFLASAVAIAVLADWIRHATEQIALRTRSTIGGLLNVTFGSIAELVLALSVLMRGEAAVVQAQITGSIIGTAVLGLGLAALIGGWGRQRQNFNARSSGLLSTMLLLVVVALLLPAIFDQLQRADAAGEAVRLRDEHLSLAASVVLLLLYGAHLVYTLVTHASLFGGRDADQAPSWPLPLAIGVLFGGTVLVAAEAELASGALSGATATLGLSPLFAGVILLALIGTSSDIVAAVAFARQDRMTMAFEICIGSALQVGLVVAPLLVLLSWLFGQPMNLVLGQPIDLFAIAATAFIVRAVAADGETNWFEGLLLIAVYALFALAYFFTAWA